MRHGAITGGPRPPVDPARGFGRQGQAQGATLDAGSGSVGVVVRDFAVTRYPESTTVRPNRRCGRRLVANRTGAQEMRLIGGTQRHVPSGLWDG